MRERLARAAWERNREIDMALGVEGLLPWEDELPGLREHWLKLIDAILEEAAKEAAPAHEDTGAEEKRVSGGGETVQSGTER